MIQSDIPINFYWVISTDWPLGPLAPRGLIPIDDSEDSSGDAALWAKL